VHGDDGAYYDNRDPPRAKVDISWPYPVSTQGNVVIIQHGDMACPYIDIM